MNAIEQLKSVLCGQEGKCCIRGSDADRAIVDRALEALTTPQQAEAVPSDVVRDAARYRQVRRGQKWSVIDGIGGELKGEALDAAADAAIAAQGEKP